LEIFLRSFLQDEGLLSLGWSPTFQFHFDELNNPDLLPARILSEDRSHYSIQLPNSVLSRAMLSGKMRNQMDEGHDKPVVGDWITCEVPTSTDYDSVVVHSLLPRKTCIKRSRPESRDQIIICNVDSIFIATSANKEFNLNRLDRYVSITLDSGAEPILILTKTDLMKKDELRQLKEQFPHVVIIGVNQKDTLSFTPLFQYLQKGLTVGLIGSSGVGKSTLINHIMGFESQKTEHIRDSDSKGRHTTTKREFIKTPFGGWIADTPGMRELGMLDQQIGVESQYADILSLGKLCRFKDCEHKTEPGCAITKALQKGELSEDKWNNYLKLKAEIEFHERKGNKTLEAEQKKVWKQFGKDLKARQNSRKNE
jgi:ribosome biogenesis GTPase / thiamine phosphate phosphatase